MADAPNPADLPALWHERAELLRSLGADSVAKVWELASGELAGALRAQKDPGLTLVDAAKLSGYTPDYLGQLVRSDAIPNAGRRGAPRIRIADLPVKGEPRVRPRNYGKNAGQDDQSIGDKLRGPS